MRITTIKHLCTYLLAGVLSIFGVSAFAQPIDDARHVVDVFATGYGAESARFNAEQAAMAQVVDSDGFAVASNLQRESHGYRMASAEPVGLPDAS